ncbi:hypothetical protein [Azomonas macrocytogenes]|uniref:Uncharacterized protein n=1 Tax=Azomonas macrocytogenes TaxID=69962 RepID=A0A839T706_AZOMA|nr:hypothetical protein [Azomonas macrocytogenes]MBB3105261.1 hypothetical protein [Azomonas macrocytogenes]
MNRQNQLATSIHDESTTAQQASHSQAAPTVETTSKEKKSPENKSTSASTQPAHIKKALRREAFNLYSRMASKAVLEDRRLALAIAITSLYVDVRNELPEALRKRMEHGLGIQSHLMPTDRAALEIQLAQRTETDLFTLLGSMAATTVFRCDNSDQFEQSVAGSQSLAYIQHTGMQPIEAFMMNEAYLKAQVKPAIIHDCKQSGFAAKYNEVKGEKAFDKLASGKLDELIKTILTFTAFSWLGYLPPALELPVQSSTALVTRRHNAA